MSTLIPSSTCALVRSIQHKQRMHSRIQIRSHKLGDEGRPSNMVDSNMNILKDRMKLITAKEQLKRNSRLYGWDYDSSYATKLKKQPQYPKTMALICGASILPVVIGTALLYILSIVDHLSL